MSYFPNQPNSFPNQVPSSSANSVNSEAAGLEATTLNVNSSNSQNGKGAIKKSANNKKPNKDKYYRNNHKFKHNEPNSYEWRPFQHPQQSWNQNYYSNTNSGINESRHPNEQSMYQKNKQYSNKYHDNNSYYGNGYKSYKVNFYNDNNWYNGSRQMQHGYDDKSNTNLLSNFNTNDQRYRQDVPSNPQRNKQKYNKNWRNNHQKQEKPDKKDIASQRERLEGMIKGRTLECLVCCEVFKYTDKIWSCKQCYHIFHMKCTQAWANSSKIENGWRCPACQNVCKDIPKDYYCFCGKVREPKNEAGLTPHSCGDVCLREGRNCEHRCLILCHPGPCPECSILVTKSCGCTKTQQQVRCSSDFEIVCDNICGKTLECALHKCDDKCHVGDCKPCQETFKQICFCGKQDRVVSCSSEFSGKENFACGEICDRLLSCNNHNCKDNCHKGNCKPCIRDVRFIRTCHCGKTPLREQRTSCLDDIPSCGLVCQKILKCGPSIAPHICKALCHEGDCPPCDLTTMLRCRCGFMDKEIPCQQLTTKADDARCEKKCTKKRLCGKHKCNQRCCIEIDHVCPLPCNHLLSCGNHRCASNCHSGRCKPCVETSFEELYCECGRSVIYPPVPCGTKPPVCSEQCVRPRECGHDVNHACHTGPCPPCTVLCKRWCYGNHEQRGTIPCHQESFSCGLSCGKQMPCGRHKCNKPCHLGACPVPCNQPCTFERPVCGHPCKAPCHEPPCRESSCKSKVPVCCPCGNLKTYKCCNELIDEFRNIEMAILSEKMMVLSKNQSVDISDLSKPKRPDILKILECNEECRVVERNRRLAIGLQIRNPDISQKLTPRYSDFMRGWAKKDPYFSQKVHDKLAELVQLAKQSKQKSRSYSFESMNRDKRHFIHEYCEHFGCESAAYDAEPNRNIVATASRDKSWLPSMSLLEVIQRENGQRKVPGPSVLDRGSCSKSESVVMRPLGRTTKLGVQVNDVDPMRK